MKNFLKKNWTLILVILYFLFPDLVPGPIDDTAFLFVERALAAYMNSRRKRKKESEMQKPEQVQPSINQVQTSENISANQQNPQVPVETSPNENKDI